MDVTYSRVRPPEESANPLVSVEPEPLVVGHTLLRLNRPIIPAESSPVLDDASMPGSLLADPLYSASNDGPPAVSNGPPGPNGAETEIVEPRIDGRSVTLRPDDPMPVRRPTKRPRQVDQHTAPPGENHRRREPRFVAIEDRIWIQWWFNGEFNGLAARLINVSRNGAMIVTGVNFQIGQEIRVFLEEPAPQIGVLATVMSVHKGKNGVHTVGLAFQTECPDAFFIAAANGFEAWLACERSRR